MKVPAELLALLRKEDTFFIATHVNPDGDALGSSLALSLALESMGKKTVLYDRDGVPGPYLFLPGHERFVSSAATDGLPVVILLDCNDRKRSGLEGAAISFSAVIDHHETARDFGDIRWVEPDAAATGMMVYFLIRELGLEITKDMAANLYSAIVVDTGTFRYSNTTAEVLRVAAELVDAGADPQAIAVNLYETWPEARFRLLLMVLNTLEITDRFAVTYVTREMFAETGTSPEDTEHFSNFPRMIGTIAVSVFFREEEDGWKVSLRSRGEIDVAATAQCFKGGGHRNAAGFTIKADLETAKARVLSALSRSALAPSD